ncbi:oligosaccharyltransferase complex subunit epsilon [Vermiconidia calcicola]|uniref:Oligosaccharyltransferase complex subunit epsilon n=1 Tax=Vermiconidia calcicola TaxID=1690605 RepID=A0ACC3N113_9PEZI|nr:oligosaccharyltransferase complex subunit epsilon [Vermiconidia calcicola]
MAPKKQAATPTPQSSKPATTTTSSTASHTPSKSQSKNTPTSSIRNAQDAQEIAVGIWNNYVEKTPQRVKLVDAFMLFLMVVGVLQFVYCVIGGNYPFNAFLSGFSATVGQFVLTASLRIQTNPENKAEFERISHERAFADFVFGSMILHFFCVNFIN